MARAGHRYAVEFYSNGAGSEVLAVRTVEVDWRPALEWTHFQGVRRGLLPAVTALPAGRIEPVWSGRDGEPYIEGVRVVLEADGRAVEERIPSRYFKRAAEEASAALVHDGVVEDGDVFRFRVVAYPRAEEPEAGPPAAPFAFREVSTPLPIDEAALAPSWTAPEEAEDLPAVLVPEDVLAEATEAKRRAGAVETGGVLVGFLHRDPATGDVFLEVSAQIEARHTKGTSTALTFTAETWTDVRAALALRNRGEILLGWWHSHPAREWCAKCDPERRATCPMVRSFFSAEDATLHRAVFPKAFHVALVAGDTPDGAGGWTDSWALYAWHRGLLAERPFHRSTVPS